MRRFFRDNGLSIVLTALFLIFWAGQSLAGYREHNNEQREHGQAEIGFSSYLRSAHFWEATSENWESEFLQMVALRDPDRHPVPERLGRVEGP